MKILFLTLGIICLLYYVASVLYGGFGLSIIWIWLVVGLSFLLAAAVWGSGFWWAIMEIIPMWLKSVGKGVIVVAIVIFGIVEGAIAFGMMQSAPENLDYIIVLGCKVNGTVPSRALRMRLDTALDYLQENPNTKAILTGGQGPGEDIAEALCMQQYLLESGIEEGRLLVEDQSTTTVENLEFSKKYVENNKGTVGIVTNNFHVFRSMKLAEKQEYENISAIPAPTGSLLVIHYMVREGIALIKEYVIGNI